MLSAATIGFFDGVHCGHRFVLRHLQEEAQKRGLNSLVVTFEQHPRSILHPRNVVLREKPQLLTTPAEREHLLYTQGIEQVLMLDFSAIQSLTARDFMQQLYTDYGVRCLLLGYDHQFGSDCLSHFEDYQTLGKAIGIEVVLLSEYQGDMQHISSTSIRKALLAGEAEKANQLLGYAYTLQGEVIAGRQIGRELGFPTANIALTTDKLIPKEGVWIVDVSGITEQPLRGLLNIGTNPTVGGKTMSIEAHILHYAGNLYGKELRLSLLHYLRAEQRFASREALQAQIALDAQVAVQF